MQFADILLAIEDEAIPIAAQTWDNSGIQVASGRTDVSTLAVCLDPTRSAVSRALELGADAILSHHPLLLHPRLPDRMDDFREVLALLLSRDVPLYAAHTSLDANPQGPAGWLAEDLRMSDVTVLEAAPCVDDMALPPYGLGIVGNLPAPLEYRDLVEMLSKYCDRSLMTRCGPPPGTIDRLAYCTGSGSSLLEAAADADAHIFVTGDVKYHAAMEAPIPVLDVGHHGLEEEMMRRMSLLLQKKLPGVRVVFLPSASPFTPAANDCPIQEAS
ncbi:MAG: Nif3-like dinuclear metal center hexameric protein [Desulfovibrio sp.]|nr:Nif3-like dinuclear metal center hexameric protein [Desulfovibrio sp.]